MKTFILFLLGLFLTGVASAQPTQAWQRLFNRGIDPQVWNPDVSIYQFRQLKPGRFAAVGGMRQHGPTGVVAYADALYLFNNQGDTLRFSTTGWSATVLSNYFDVAPLAGCSGDMLLAGTGGALGTQGYSFIARADSLGRERWRRTYHAGVTSFAFQKLLALPDGGALWVTPLLHPNSTSSRTILQPTVVRLDSVGNVVWQRSYGEPYGEGNLLTVEPVPDGSYLLTGYHPRPIPGPGFLVSDAWVLRITPEGDTIRSRYIGTGAATTSEVAYNGHLLPGGGVLLGGSLRPGIGSSPAQPVQGWVAWLDSLDRLQTSYALPLRGTRGGEVRNVLPLAGPDSAVLVTGYRTGGYVGRYTRRQGQVAMTWEQDVALPAGLAAYHTDHAVLAPNQELTMAGPVFGTPTQGILTRFVNAGVPYQPDLCRTPPEARAAYAVPPAHPDSLNLFDISDAGPRYGQLVRWRWTLGDGTVVERGRPGWVRHRYAALPALGTPVTLTVTNNLGCSHTQTLFPFGLPTASQQGRGLAVRATLHPNPATGTATLTLPQVPPGPVTVRVLNALGQQVRAYAPRPAGGALTQALDLTGLAPGVYAVHVATTRGRFVKRLVRQ